MTQTPIEKAFTAVVKGVKARDLIFKFHPHPCQDGQVEVYFKKCDHTPIMALILVNKVCQHCGIESEDHFGWYLYDPIMGPEDGPMTGKEAAEEINDAVDEC